jgi:hypothetical protein
MKETIVIATTVFACLALFILCEIQTVNNRKQILIAGFEAGCRQTFIKSDGYAPRLVWDCSKPE